MYAAKLQGVNFGSSEGMGSCLGLNLTMQQSLTITKIYVVV